MLSSSWIRPVGIARPSSRCPITIVLFPPRSPELNPVENVWQFMRDNWLSNRVFTSYDDIVDHCCEAWNKLVDRPWTIMSIGMRNWAHRVTIIGTWYYSTISTWPVTQFTVTLYVFLGLDSPTRPPVELPSGKNLILPKFPETSSCCAV